MGLGLRAWSVKQGGLNGLIGKRGVRSVRKVGLI